MYCSWLARQPATNTPVSASGQSVVNMICLAQAEEHGQQDDMQDLRLSILQWIYDQRACTAMRNWQASTESLHNEQSALCIGIACLEDIADCWRNIHEYTAKKNILELHRYVRCHRKPLNSMPSCLLKIQIVFSPMQSVINETRWTAMSESRLCHNLDSLYTHHSYSIGDVHQTWLI